MDKEGGNIFESIYVLRLSYALVCVDCDTSICKD